MGFEAIRQRVRARRIAWLLGLLLVAATGCVYAITGDADTVDRFAQYERTGGDCIDVPSESPELSSATQYRWLLWQLTLAELRAASGRVRYDKLRTDVELTAILARAVAQLPQLQPTSLATPAERLAFWINAYNLLVLHAASRAWQADPAFRVDQNDFAFFQQQVHRVAQHTFSLNQIENGVLRGDRLHPSIFYFTDEEYAPFQALHDEIWDGATLDPRIHFVLNCASTSCPALPAQPLLGTNLEEALESATAAFLSDENKGAGPEGMSQIFDFYAQDFEADGGIEGFIARYRDLREIDTGRFLPYDWSLNLETPP